MKLHRLAAACGIAALFACVTLAPAQQSPQPRKKKKLLAIGAVQGFQHDSVSHGLGTMWKLGQETGLWDTYIRTDVELLTKKNIGKNAKTLNYFDAVFFYTTGELAMSDDQKADLLSFIRDDGKGFIGGHSAIDTFYKWPEYGEMIGAYFDAHPWNQFQAPILVEDNDHSITRHLPKKFYIYDEIYQPSKEFSREKLRVLMRLDPSEVDWERRGVKRQADKDVAVAWIKKYGKGRVFWSTLGHREEVWERPDIQKVYLEAAKWALGITAEGDVSPRPIPAPASK